MTSLTDYIEDYLKKLLLLSAERYIDVRRSELAGKFSCVPSQINYVLSRRFTLERGYLVESRRGGAGYIRIYRIESGQVEPWQQILEDLEEDVFEPARVRLLLRQLVDEKVVSRREAAVLNAVMSDEHYFAAGEQELDTGRLKLNIFLSALKEILKTGY